MLVQEKQLAASNIYSFFEGLASHTAGEKPGRNISVTKAELVLLGFLRWHSGGKQVDLLQKCCFENCGRVSK